MRWRTTGSGVGAAVLLLGSTGLAVGGGGSAPARAGPMRPTVAEVVRYAAPVQPVVVLTAFHPPPGPYQAGHLGVDLAAAQGAMVRAAADGVVTFAGPVAGRGVVVIRHADGIRTEYEPLSPAVHAGAMIRRGQVIGTVAGAHAYCRGRSCLHWGARRGAAYLDPLSLLRALGPVRLLPWPGTAVSARPPPVVVVVSGQWSGSVVCLQCSAVRRGGGPVDRSGAVVRPTRGCRSA